VALAGDILVAMPSGDRYPRRPIIRHAGPVQRIGRRYRRDIGRCATSAATLAECSIYAYGPCRREERRVYAGSATHAQNTDNANAQTQASGANRNKQQIGAATSDKFNQLKAHDSRKQNLGVTFNKLKLRKMRGHSLYMRQSVFFTAMQ